MNRITCYFERISDFAVGLFLLFLGLALTYWFWPSRFWARNAARNVHWLHDEPRTFCIRNGLTVNQFYRLPHPQWLSLKHAFALDRRSRIVYRLFTINLNVESMQ
jgi:hypothetical protein